MKKILIISLILISSKGFGQTSGSFTGVLNIPEYFQNDTIRVIMLCADTTGMIYNSTTGIIKFLNNKCFWQYGYEVADRAFIVSQFIMYKYLDEDKQELSKNIVVWDSKQIK